MHGGDDTVGHMPHLADESSQLRDVVERARARRGAMRTTSLDERCASIRRVAAQIAAERDSFVQLGIAEGILQRNVVGQLATVERVARDYDAVIDRMRPRRLDGPAQQWLVREPFGVVGIMLAGSSPITLTFVALAAACGAGNAVVVRSPSAAPRVSGRIIELFQGEMPDGCVQRASCAASTMLTELAENPAVNAVLLYGGSVLGKSFLEHFGAHCGRTREVRHGIERIGARLKKFVPELAGNDALIVLPDADLDFAAEAAVRAAYSAGGQLCFSAKRLLVHQSVLEVFLEKVVRPMNAIRVGKPSDPDAEIGPLPVGTKMRTRAMHQLEDARVRGGRVVVGGAADDEFVWPTLVQFDARAIRGRDEADKPLLWVEECFAPIRSIVAFDDDRMALELAADSVYGLGASLFGNEETCLELARSLDVGRIMINEAPTYQDIRLPIGGVADSGFYGATQKIEELAYTKVLHVGRVAPP